MASELLARAVAAMANLKDETLSDAVRLEACRILDTAMLELSRSASVSADEWEFAQHWREDVRHHFRHGLPEVMRTLAALTLAAEDAAIRREASELLESAARKLRELGRDLSNWRFDAQ